MSDNIYLLRWSDISLDQTVFIGAISFEEFVSIVEGIKGNLKEGTSFSQDKAYVIDSLAKHNIKAIDIDIHTLWRFYS